MIDTRQQLVEEWKAKLEASSQPPVARGERFAWVRQIYTRIYRFLVSCYGQGEWSGVGDDSSASADTFSNASRMPYVDNCPTTDGLAPKSPERIRAALDSIHSSNPGIATTGTMTGVDDDTWVVVAAGRKSQYLKAVYRRLVACGIDAMLQNRTTDGAVIVRHADFQKALAVAQTTGRAKQIKISTRATVDPEQFQISTGAQVNLIASVGIFLLISSVLTLHAFILLNDTPQLSTTFAFCAFWIVGLASGWLCIRGRRLR